MAVTDQAEPRARVFFAPLVVLFFLSGVSGLIYQVVWFRMLSRVFGVTVYAVTTVLLVFMAGLALGSLAASKVAPKSSPLRAYAVLELLVGLTGAASSWAIVALPSLFQVVLTRLGEGSPAITVVRVLLSCVVLLPPTFLMGATLPILSAHVTQRRDVLGARAGLLYGVNTLGAVVGVIATGFVLIAALGEKRTVLVAVGVNVAIGALSLVLAARTPAMDHAEEARGAAATETAGPSRTILLAAFASGVVALAFEVIWFRIMTLLLGNSVYGFSCMLGAYLIGIGAGSVVMSRHVHRLRRPMAVFGVLEIVVALLAVLSLEVFLAVGLRSTDAKYVYGLLWDGGDFVKLAVSSLLIVLPATFVYGAIFPLAARLVSEPSAGASGDASAPGRPEVAVGRLYAFNTLGNVVGSPIAVFLLIPAIGTRATFLVMATASVGIGVALLSVSRARERSVPTRPRETWALFALVLACLGMTAFLAAREDPFLRILRERNGGATLLAHEEDRGATVSLFEDHASGTRNLFINGLYVSNTSPGVGEEMVNFPLAFDPDPGPKRILAVGLGVGAILRYAVDTGHDITVAELQRSVVDLFRRFSPDGEKYLESPHARVVLSDGRNYLLGTNERYDLIIVDGSPPVYASGMVNLYSHEFAELARDHLTPHGVFVVWFPVVCFESDFWMVARNFADVFPATEVYSIAATPNALMMGSLDKGAFSLDLESLATRLERFRGHPPLTAVNLSEGMSFSEAELRRRASAYPTVTDDRPYTEFPLIHFLRGETYQPNNQFLYPARFPPGTHRCTKGDGVDCAAECDAGQTDSCYLLGGLYLAGGPGHSDPRLAAAAFDRACAGGSFAACKSLAHLVQSGEGVPADPARAAELFSVACDHGVPAACNDLGVAYRLGRGVARDDGKAVALIGHACRSGVMVGCFDLGALYETGVGVEASLPHAMELYVDACAHGGHAGCDRVVAMLHGSHADGAFGDEGAARAALGRACAEGYAAACQ